MSAQVLSLLELLAIAKFLLLVVVVAADTLVAAVQAVFITTHPPCFYQAL
jgi:hypothetical protein